MPLFEVAVIQRPSKKEAEEGAFETLVQAPVAVVAADPQSAAILVATQKSITMNPNTQVIVRPFE